MHKSELIQQIKNKKSLLCVGLDTDVTKLPVGSTSQIDFNRAIIQATSPSAVAYKINTAFYECQGIPGWQAMEETLDAIPADCFKIADAKRGDIGNTSHHYALTFFEKLKFDAITVSPYMGIDSIKPFLEFSGKWVIILALTSNSGSHDFQRLSLTNGLKLYEQVINTACTWGSEEQIMFVVGATNADHIGQIRKNIPDHFLLIPGVGTQGGDLGAVIAHGANAEGGLLINVSRDIIFQSGGKEFAQQAGVRAQYYQQLISAALAAR